MILKMHEYTKPNIDKDNSDYVLKAMFRMFS